MIRVLAAILGVVFIFVGAEVLFFPIFGGFKEKLNAVSTLLLGGVFFHYAITGKMLFRKSINK